MSNGKNFKECKVIMLSTNEKALNGLKTIITICDNKLQEFKSDNIGNIKFAQFFGVPQHLYIISDEEIKEGDWVTNKFTTYPYKATYTLEEELRVNGNKNNQIGKIIATTDISLGLTGVGKGFLERGEFMEAFTPLLPQPSLQFISKYIEEYNKGNIITNVLVEYEDNGEEDWIGSNEDGQPFWNEKWELKVDSHNQITIKPVQPKLYTEEEVDYLCWKAFTYHYNMNDIEEIEKIKSSYQEFKQNNL